MLLKKYSVTYGQHNKLLRNLRLLFGEGNALPMGDLCSQSIHIYDVRLPSTWRELYSDVVMPGNLEIVMIVMGSCRVASVCSSCVNIPKAFAHPC